MGVTRISFSIHDFKRSLNEVLRRPCSDEALAAFVTASGNQLRHLSVNNVRKVSVLFQIRRLEWFLSGSDSILAFHPYSILRAVGSTSCVCLSNRSKRKATKFYLSKSTGQRWSLIEQPLLQILTELHV